MKIMINGELRDATAAEEAAVLAAQVKVIPTAGEKDASANDIAKAFIEDNPASKATFLVIADVIEQAFGVSQSVARQQVRTRFKDYYRAILDE